MRYLNDNRGDDVIGCATFAVFWFYVDKLMLD